MRYHYTPREVLKLKQANKGKNLISSVGKDAKRLDLSYFACGNGNVAVLNSHSWKTVWQFLMKLDIHLL